MSLVDTAKSAYDLAKKGMTVEFEEKIMQLREEALQLQEENLQLKKENRELRDQIELQETMRFDQRVYWRDGDSTPYCPLCYEKSHAMMHLNGPSRAHDRHGMYVCLACKTEYQEEKGRGFIPWHSPGAVARQL